MLNLLTVNKSIEIKANRSQVWDALINPEIIKHYLFGTETVSDWKVGSPIIFQGEYDGQKYKDKGEILEIREEKILKYSYWSGFSGLVDIDENYATVTYKLELHGDHIDLTLIQKGFASEEARGHSETAWDMVLAKIKELVEAN